MDLFHEAVWVTFNEFHARLVRMHLTSLDTVVAHWNLRIQEGAPQRGRNAGEVEVLIYMPLEEESQIVD